MTGNELKALRKTAGYSRPALAGKCGLHPDSLKYWENKPVVDLRGHAVGKMLEVLGPVDHPPDDMKQERLSAPTRRALMPDGGFLRTIPRARGGVLGNSSRSGGRHGKMLCGAKTPKGTACRARALPGKARCKFHGGMSTGPKTAEGRERICEAQRKRWATHHEASQVN